MRRLPRISFCLFSAGGRGPVATKHVIFPTSDIAAADRAGHVGNLRILTQSAQRVVARVAPWDQADTLAIRNCVKLLLLDDDRVQRSGAGLFYW
jgi:hypothetical protein